MTPGIELDKVTTCIRGGLRAHTASVRLYYWESVHNMAYLGIIIRQAMEAYDEHHALLARVDRAEAKCVYLMWLIGGHTYYDHKMLTRDEFLIPLDEDKS